MIGRGVLPLVDAQFFESLCDLCAVGSRFHRCFDVKEFPIFPNVEGRTTRAFAIGNAIVCSGLAIGITQDRVVEFEFFRKFLVSLFVVAACGKICDIEFPNFFATLTERLAFGRSSPGKGLGIPRHDDGLFAFKIGEFVGFAVASLQREVRCIVANRKVGPGVCSQSSHSEKESCGQECLFHSG